MDENKLSENGTNEFQGFQFILKKTISAYEGKHKDLVKYCPPFFSLLCKILNDKFTDWNTKLMIDAALAYFVLPCDIIPDHQETGYVDDLFIVSHVLKEIKEKVSPDLIEANWDGEEKILPLINYVYQKSSEIVSEHKLEILRKVGLQKYQALDLAEYSGTYPQKICKLANEKRELFGLLVFLIKQVYHTNLRGWKTEAIKEFLQKQCDYGEIDRLIELSKMNHQYSAPPKKIKTRETNRHLQIEERLRQARMRALIEDEIGNDNK